MLHSMARDGDTILPRVTGLRSAPGVPLVGPGEWPHAPGVCGRRFRSRACGRRDPRGAPEGQQQGEGHTSVVAARAPGALLRVVRPPRARRRRHGDLPGQGAGHLPCRVSRPVSRRPVAAGGAVGTAAASPAPRPGISPAQAQLLVLTPAAGHEGASGVQSAKTREMEACALQIFISPVSAIAVDLMGRAMEPPRASIWPIVLSQQRPQAMTQGAPRRCFLPHSPGHLCYDVRTHEPRGRASGREETRWTLSQSWIR
jgi:hypothetical protein